LRDKFYTVPPPFHDRVAEAFEQMAGDLLGFVEPDHHDRV
jgi:hypothetical protein